MTNELKPCPFCGGKVEEYVDVQGFRNYFCTKCPCSLAGDFEHYMTARKAWNSRADSTALAAAQEREARLIIQVSDLEHLARALCRQLPKDNVVRRQVLDYLAQHGLQAAFSQSSHEQARQSPADDAAAEFGPVTEAELDAARVVIRQAPTQGEPANPIENLVAELTADVQDYAEPPQLDPVHNALLRASSWISHVPHGDNCFLMNEGEYNRCYCGRDAVLEAINDALMVVESEDHKLVPLEPTEAMSLAGALCEPFQRYPNHPDEPAYTPGAIIANSCYRAMIAAAPSGKEGE